MAKSEGQSPDSTPGQEAPAGQEALAEAGWSDAELTWEHVQEAAAEALAEGRWDEAADFWETGLNLARETFGATDPRLAASLTNRAVVERWAGRDEPAATLFAEALAVWDRSDPWVAGLAPERRARSSTFHLRMETKHRGAYDRHSRVRYEALAAEGRALVLALQQGPGTNRGALARWRRDRPAGYTDLRRLLAAVLLTADPSVQA